MRHRWLSLLLAPCMAACGGGGGAGQTTRAISGKVTGASGATVALAGARSASTTTDESGNYSFVGLANGGYTVTPSKTGYTFSPASLSPTVEDADVTGQDFTATCPRDCQDKYYGDADGCGGTCTIDCGGRFCPAVPTCTPACSGRCIGDFDGCGAVCTLGQGADNCTCVPSCDGKCAGDSDGCGFVCFGRDGSHDCCTPDCTGKCEGADDGCGSACTAAQGGTACACTPDCSTKCEGADDGCGFACKTNLGPLCCLPVCAGLPHGASDGCGGICGEKPNVVFITSVSGTGNLGSWADAGGRSGVAAGDAICQARAVSAGLPGTFRAWISDQNDDAYCRVHGLSGKKAANCGQAMLPASAGPWVRTDGFPFASLQQVVSGIPYTPILYDETRTAQQSELSFTASYGGVVDPNNTTPCSNWTSVSVPAPPYVAMGDAYSSSQWESGGSTLCSFRANLICFQEGAGLPLPPLTSAGKRVFMTSKIGTGNLGTWSGAGGKTGVAAGDAICQSLAASAPVPVPGTFVAWLSDPTTSAADRLGSNGPWVRMDGVRIAASKAELTSGTLFTTLMLNESGGASYAGVWTGTDDDGIRATATCTGWTSDASAINGTWGNPVYVKGWSSNSPSHPTEECDSLNALYCFEE